MVKNSKQLLAELQTYWDRTDREGRDLSYTERGEVENLLGAIKAQKSIDDQLAQFGPPFGELIGHGAPNAQNRRWYWRSVHQLRRV